MLDCFEIFCESYNNQHKPAFWCLSTKNSIFYCCHERETKPKRTSLVLVDKTQIHVYVQITRVKKNKSAERYAQLLTNIGTNCRPDHPNMFYIRQNILGYFGGLILARSKFQAPPEASTRCMDCPVNVESMCPYSAKKIYLDKGFGWPASVVCDIEDHPG